MELGKQLSVVGIVKLLFLNAPTYGYHLWYLAALCYVLVIEAALDITRSEKLKRAAEMCSIALLAIGIIIPIVCKAFDLPYRIEIVRNFLFEGYPNQKYFNENREKSNERLRPEAPDVRKSTVCFN